MAATATKVIAITPPNFQRVRILIEGTAPYVQLRFSEKTKNEMAEKHEAGSTAASKRKREPKDFAALYQQALYRDTEGRYGIPAPAFRNAMISACRIVGFVMTRAKLAVFVDAEGIDASDYSPLVPFVRGEPSEFVSMTRNKDGSPDMRMRAIWKPGWQVMVPVRFDADMFTQVDIVNLMNRVGQQVGVGEGRPDSKDSNGQGWGHFRIASAVEG